MFVVDIGGGHHGYGPLGTGRIVESFLDSPSPFLEESLLACRAFFSESSAHSKAPLFWNSEDVFSPPLFQKPAGFSSFFWKKRDSIKKRRYFYPKAQTPFPFLSRHADAPRQQVETEDILDAIAFIHLVHFPVQEPARLKSALAHLESMIALSHESWKFILAETDDDHEWVPNTKQHSVMPNGAVTLEMVKAWFEFLAEAKAILKGEKLIPFWRRGPESGINLKRVLTEPRTFDLVLWVQGTAAVPYLENGVCTSAETWSRFQRIFRGEFIGFALWFN